ncbi:alpha/beta fold hydrolase [Anatilimnocola sp. NA78]|uniref:alpha/beta fold hydrolase n=1 Tax=Anatilimnocola sp. NA78 TaxID=3415683 RepID=UPI003CE4A8E4
MLRFVPIAFVACSICLATHFAAAADQLPPLKKDIEFAKVGDVSLKLDAFVPEGKGPFPTCILVHGGGFMRGTKQHYITPLFDPLSKAGYTWFTIDYRLAPAHRWPACADDVTTAIRWVKEHAAEYKVDLNRVALIGESAGGHLVSWVGAQNEKEKLGLAAVVPIYAPHDLEFQVQQRKELGPSMKALLGLEELNDDAWLKLRGASITTNLPSKLPPYLLIHGTKDEQVPYEQSTRFQEKMKAAGNRCDLITIEGGIHGMGGWDKLNSNYRHQLVAWLDKTLQDQEQPGSTFSGKQSNWNGFQRYDFDIAGKNVLVVAPDQAAPGKPWVWHGEFFGHKPAPDIALLKRGFHIVYLSVPNMLGSPKAVGHWNDCYAELTSKYGLAPKVSLFGLSRGGLYCYNWAAANPYKVACIYGDAPVCDFKSWPGGKPLGEKWKGKGSAGDWKLVLALWGFKDNDEAIAYTKNPVDNLEPLAKAKIPLLHVYGDADDVVPWDENTGVIAERYKKLGGDITLIAKPSIGHHPHGLEDSTPIVEFIAKHGISAASSANSSSP